MVGEPLSGHAKRGSQLAVYSLPDENLNVLALACCNGQSVSNPRGLPPLSETVITPVWLLLISLSFAILTGFLSEIHPALHATTLVPDKALKYE